MSATAAPRGLRNVRLLAFDVDGVFTDGRFYLDDNGIETKAFHTQDGFGIRRVLDAGCQVAVISGRESNAVVHRMSELGVPHVVLGCKDKVRAFDDLLSQLDLNRDQAAFTGDDIPDLPLLLHAGIAFAVANAVTEVKEVADYVTTAGGGSGAVREICDLLLAATAS